MNWETVLLVIKGYEEGVFHYSEAWWGLKDLGLPDEIIRLLIKENRDEG